MDNQEGSRILNRIIGKGGLYGVAAKVYAGNNKKTDQFIRECFAQCHNRSAQEHWGNELVSDIKKYIELKSKNAD